MPSGPSDPELPSSRTPPLVLSSRIVIVGAGIFGLSTALHLLNRGYTDVTVVDRAKQLPAVDAASTDINKVVRSCYSDVFYTKLAREAMEEWKKPVWEGCYHECGVINVGQDKYDERLKENDRQVGAPVEDLPNTESVRAKLLHCLRSSTESTTTPKQSDLNPNEHRVGPLTNYTGYFNSEGGWAEAARAVGILLRLVREKGGKVFENQEVVSLVKGEDGRSSGVRCRDGKRYEGDRIVLTVGSWTASTFPSLELDSQCLATGQSVAMIQLSPAERERYQDCPIYLDFESGFYTFPPTKEGIVKLAIHTAGHTHMVSPAIADGESESESGSVTTSAPGPISTSVSGSTPLRKISTPRTIVSHPDEGEGLRVPRSALKALREELGKVYPELAEKPWVGTRMCWYTDSPDGNWVIGPYPGDPTLFLATSGSGHAFKFLPNIGRLIADSLEGKLDAATAARFAVDRDVFGAKNGERASHITHELDLEELCGPEDVLAV